MTKRLGSDSNPNNIAQKSEVASSLFFVAAVVPMIFSLFNLFQFNPKNTLYSTMNETKYSSLSSVEGKYVPARNGYTTYPAMRRPIDNLQQKGCPSDKVLIRTGGNALQAVSRQALEQEGLMAVSVPNSLVPGDNLYVRAPDGSDRVVLVVVPDGALPGHTFLVKMPVEEAAPVAVMGIPVSADLLDHDTASQQQHQNDGRIGGGGAQVVAGHDIESTDLRLMEESSSPEHVYDVSHQQQPSSEVELASGRNSTTQDRRNTNATPESTDPNVVLIKVPRGAAPGTKFRVKVPDGRTIDATVPPGYVQEFYLRLPRRKQNWHDNPLAVAPMIFGPMFL
jgi:hypothetical protein